MNPKKIGKAFLSRLLEAQVKALRKKHDITVVAVAGSVGKTSTKFAIAAMLGTKLRVRFQEGNYNDRVTVPLIFFGETESGIYDIPAWLKLLRRNRRALKHEYPYDVVVVELGTDGPGQMEQFAYLQPDLVVVTAIAPEHMEYFKTLDAVAAEELQVARYAKRLLVNADDTPKKYLQNLSYKSYGVATTADYMTAGRQQLQLGVTEADIIVPGEPNVFAKLHLLGAQGAKICLAAAASAHMLGFSGADIREGLEAIKPVSGRMQILPGKKQATIIDDTYNASPIAVKAALDVLYAMDAPQKIAILGSMNELGDTSTAAHQEVGEYCDPAKLNELIIIGKEAAAYLAPVAKERGCRVVVCATPYEAGAYALQKLQSKAVILAKGSQNGVFAEEALKALLANPEDTQKLVRQSPYWMSIKKQQFGEPDGSAPAPSAPDGPPAAAS